MNIRVPRVFLSWSLGLDFYSNLFFEALQERIGCSTPPRNRLYAPDDLLLPLIRESDVVVLWLQPPLIDLDPVLRHIRLASSCHKSLIAVIKKGHASLLPELRGIHQLTFIETEWRDSYSTTCDTIVDAVRKQAAQRSVFICYRRKDTPDAAGRLYDRMLAIYGVGRVFRDIDSVPLGVNFVSFIDEKLRHCAAVLVIIGRNWSEIADSHGKRRLDDPTDHVRVEIVAALRQQVPVIPILVENASMPQVGDLPEDIRPLAFHNGQPLSTEFWQAGVERLIKELDRMMKP